MAPISENQTARRPFDGAHWTFEMPTRGRNVFEIPPTSLACGLTVSALLSSVGRPIDSAVVPPLSMPRSFQFLNPVLFSLYRVAPHNARPLAYPRQKME